MEIQDVRNISAHKLKNKISDRSYQLVVNNASLLAGLDYLVEPAEASSATKINKIIDVITDEINIQEETLDTILETYQYWVEQKLANLRSLSSQISSLKAQTNDLILTMDKTEGFFFTVGDVFIDLKNIDVKATTALVDTTSGNVHGALDPNIATQDLVQIQDIPAITFDVISESVPELSSDLVGYELDKIYDKSLDSQWIHKVVLGIPSVSPVLGIVMFDFGKLITSTHLELVAGNNYTTSPYIADIIVSEDGITWQSITQKTSVNGVLSLPMEIQSFRFLKLFLGIQSPTAYEESKAVYQFQIKEFRLFANQYKTDSVLYTQPITVNDENGDQVLFSSVALNTCEILPTGTSLNCYVSFGNAGVFSSYQSIVPINRTPGSVVHVNTAVLRTTATSFIDNNIIYQYNYNNNKSLDFSLTADINQGSIQIIRDIGNWSNTNSSWYTLVFYISSSQDLDFRETNVYLNGQFKNTKETYGAGIYTLRTESLANTQILKDYISTFTTDIGGYLATGLDISNYNKIDPANYNYFAISPSQSGPTSGYDEERIIVKKKDSNETFRILYVSSLNNTTADSFKLKFQFNANSDYTLTPVLTQWSIKVNRII